MKIAPIHSRQTIGARGSPGCSGLQAAPGATLGGIGLSEFATRRRLISAAPTAAALAFASGVLAQPAPKVWRAGVLTLTDLPESRWNLLRENFAKLGYTEGRNLKFESRSARNDSAALPALAAELVKLKVDVLIVNLTPAAVAAQRATKDIPIVMLGTGDPVGVGLVASLARPGGNITGFSSAAVEVGVKCLEFLHDIAPAARRVGILANSADPLAKRLLAAAERGALTLKVELRPALVRSANEYDAVFAAWAKERVGAVLLQPSLPLQRAVDLALKYKLPSASFSTSYAESGVLMSYGADLQEQYRKVPHYVDRIFKGARPADLPVEEPNRFQLVVNRKTARAIGVAIPHSVLLRADQVIE